MAFAIGLGFIVMIFLFMYLRQIAIKNMEKAHRNLSAGMKVKRKSGSFSYEIVQESPHFFYLKDLKHHHKIMVAKDKIHREFDVEL